MDTMLAMSLVVVGALRPLPFPFFLTTHLCDRLGSSTRFLLSLALRYS